MGNGLILLTFVIPSVFGFWLGRFLGLRGDRMSKRVGQMLAIIAVVCVPYGITSTFHMNGGEIGAQFSNIAAVYQAGISDAIFDQIAIFTVIVVGVGLPSVQWFHRRKLQNL